MADRGLQPGRGLGRLAALLTGTRCIGTVSAVSPLGWLSVVRPLDLTDVAPVARLAPTAPGRRWVLLLVAGWLVQAGLRAWLSRAQMVPLATPDESAYLIAARVMSGRRGGQLLLLHAVPGRVSAAHHAGVLVHSSTRSPCTTPCCSGSTRRCRALVMPLGYVACRRLGLERPWAFGVAMVAALLPAALFYSQYAMTDAIFPVLVLGWLLAVHSWLTAWSVAGPVRGGDRVGPAGRVRVRGALPGRGHGGRVRAGGRPGRLAAAGAAADRRWRPRWRCACRWARATC